MAERDKSKRQKSRFGFTVISPRYLPEVKCGHAAGREGERVIDGGGLVKGSVMKRAASGTNGRAAVSA